MEVLSAISRDRTQHLFWSAPAQTTQRPSGPNHRMVLVLRAAGTSAAATGQTQPDARLSEA
jgi:hypothetical protein